MKEIREKILLLLLGGIAFGYSVTPGQQRMVLRTISREWNRVGKKELKEGIKYLYKLDFIDKEVKKDGSMMLLLTKKGRLKSLDIKLNNVKNKKGKWDGKWRMVAFDIPEKYKLGRDALRNKLKKVGFCEMQKSVLVTPFNCEKEIGLLIKFFELNKYVRFGVLESIDNSTYFKRVFKLD